MSFSTSAKVYLTDTFDCKQYEPKFKRTVTGEKKKRVQSQREFENLEIPWIYVQVIFESVFFVSDKYKKSVSLWTLEKKFET